MKNQDAIDKHDPSIQFNAPYTPSKEEVEAGEKIAAVFQSNASAEEKSEQVWNILNSRG